jgi:WD40 repeat protein
MATALRSPRSLTFAALVGMLLSTCSHVSPLPTPTQHALATATADVATPVVSTPTLPATPEANPTPTSPRLQELRSFQRRAFVLAFSPNGDSMAVVPRVSSVELISVEDGTLLSAFDIPWGTTGSIGTQALAFSPDGTVLAAGGAEARVDTWLLEDGTILRSAELPVLFDYDPIEWFDSVYDLAFVDEHSILVSAAEDTGGLVIWDSLTGRYTRLLTKPVLDIAPIPGTQSVALATWSVGVFADSDAPVLIYDLSARRTSLALFEDDPRAREVSGFPATSDTVTVSPDGRLLAAIVSDQLRVYDLAERREVPVAGPQGPFFSQLRFSPTGRLAIVTSTYGNCMNARWATQETDCTLSIWDSVTWTLLAQAAVPHLTTLDFSPDGTELATGGFDEVVRIWAVP